MSARAPVTDAMRELAEKVTELYWPQADAFGVGVVPRVLSQITTRKRGILGMIREFRESDAGDPGAPPARSRAARGAQYEALLDRVEWTLNGARKQLGCAVHDRAPRRGSHGGGGGPDER